MSSSVIVIQQKGATLGYEARRDGSHGEGSTLGAALDRLFAQTGEPSEAILLIPQDRPDSYFSQRDIDRLQALQANLFKLTAEEEAEREALVAKEFRATIQRTALLISPEKAL